MPQQQQKKATTKKRRASHGVRRFRTGQTTRFQALNRLNNQGRVFLNLLTYASPKAS